MDTLESSPAVDGVAKLRRLAGWVGEPAWAESGIVRTACVWLGWWRVWECELEHCYCKKEEQLLDTSPRTAHQAMLSHHQPHALCGGGDLRLRSFHIGRGCARSRARLGPVGPRPRSRHGEERNHQAARGARDAFERPPAFAAAPTVACEARTSRRRGGALPGMGRAFLARLPGSQPRSGRSAPHRQLPDPAGPRLDRDQHFRVLLIGAKVLRRGRDA